VKEGSPLRRENINKGGINLLLGVRRGAGKKTCHKSVWLVSYMIRIQKFCLPPEEGENGWSFKCVTEIEENSDGERI